MVAVSHFAYKVMKKNLPLFVFRYRMKDFLHFLTNFYTFGNMSNGSLPYGWQKANQPELAPQSN